MATKLNIYEIGFDLEFDTDGHKVTYTQIGNSIYDSDIIEKLECVSMNYWHLEGECGFLGELTGSDIHSILSNYDGKEPKNIDLILKKVTDNDEYYRIEVSF